MQTPTLVLLTSMFPPTRASKGGRGLSLSFLRPLRLGRRAAGERNAAKEERQCTACCCVNISLAEQHCKAYKSPKSSPSCSHTQRKQPRNSGFTRTYLQTSHQSPHLLLQKQLNSLTDYLTGHPASLKEKQHVSLRRYSVTFQQHILTPISPSASHGFVPLSSCEPSL